MIDFGSLKKPDVKSKSTDPKEIFKRRPSGEGAANDLWQGQAEALDAWFKAKADETLVLLNTGAGKTIIGLLMAQSYVNQTVRNVVYVCSTIDLVHQTAKEAAKLGLAVTCRHGGNFDNDLFVQGKAFCITTYPALFNSFRGAQSPGALIFDDAHVAGKSIRDAFTLTIERSDHTKIFADIVELIRPSFADCGQKLEFESAIKEDSTGAVLLAPPCATFDLSDKLSDLLNTQITDADPSLFFPWQFLKDHLKFCAFFVGRSKLEITPPFLPTLKLRAFAKGVKRVYLSATINSKADFTRIFGHKPDTVIAPNVDAGDGERLFLFASRFEKGKVDPNIVKAMATKTKVLIAVPSKARGGRWDFAALPTAKAFSDELNKFRAQKAGAFVIAGRFDGIDLPGSQCRAMVVDGLPTGTNLIEQYLFENLLMDRLHSNTLSVRITQLLGRIIRGRQDFGFFLIADRAVENWLKNDRNRILMPELLRKQLFLSESIEAQLRETLNLESALDMMEKLISRDEGWVNFYRDNIDAADFSEATLRESEEENAILEDAGKNEVWFMTKLWDNDLQAYKELEAVIKDVAIFDPMLAGWYSMWVGVTHHAAGQSDAALDMFDEARRRIGHKLPLPRRPPAVQQKIEPSKTVIEEAIRQIADNSVMRINDRIAKLRALTTDAFSKTTTHKQCEEAVRELGSAIGFFSSRPCTDFGKGPDNLWIDVHRKQMIAFELKTDKSADSTLTKDDIGQGLNHIEWLKTQHKDLELLGLIFLTDCEKVSDKASASEKMHFGTQDKLRKVWDDFLGTVDRIKTKAPLEKIVDASKTGELPEWSPTGIHKRLVTKQCNV